MKSLIESVKNYWKGFVKLFKDTPESYYYKMDGKQDPIKVPVDEKCCSGTDCVCKDTSDYTYEESVADSVPETTAEPLHTKEQLKALSKLELQVMAQNAGVTLSGKEKKQQILNKLVKHLAL
jgi:hypothetical protein